MSGNQSAETTLSKKRFEFEVEIEDPPTGVATTITMEVDTGSPIAVALPQSYAAYFSDQLTTVDLGGAGTRSSPAYDATVTRVGSIDLEYQTMAVMTLTNSNYGLLGIELLKYMDTEIYDKPNRKTLRIEDEYL